MNYTLKLVTEYVDGSFFLEFSELFFSVESLSGVGVGW